MREPAGSICLGGGSGGLGRSVYGRKSVVTKTVTAKFEKTKVYQKNCVDHPYPPNNFFELMLHQYQSHTGEPELGGDEQAQKLWRLYGAVCKESAGMLTGVFEKKTELHWYDKPQDVEKAVFNNDSFVYELGRRMGSGRVNAGTNPLTKVIRLAVKRYYSVQTNHAFYDNKKPMDTAPKACFDTYIQVHNGKTGKAGWDSAKNSGYFFGLKVPRFTPSTDQFT